MFAEKELLPLGFCLAEKDDRKSVLSISHLKLQFNCCCPAYPHIIVLGCPIHHPGSPGGSWPVEEAKKIPIALGIGNSQT